MKKSFIPFLIRGIIFSTLLLAVNISFGSEQIYAQKNDHLTVKESELVQEAQEIDRRMSVFIKAINRRFLVLENKTEKIPEKQSKKEKKESELWGDLPNNPRSKLISDIEKILDEAIVNIDDAANRDSQKSLFPKRFTNSPMRQKNLFLS